MGVEFKGLDFGCAVQRQQEKGKRSIHQYKQQSENELLARQNLFSGL